MKRTITAVLVALLVLSVAAVPAVAHEGSHAGNETETVDECKNSDAGPSGDAGPPGFVGGLVPDFVGDLIGGLPVPGFVKGLFGASTC